MTTPRDVLIQLLAELTPLFRIRECTESRFKQYSLCVERPGKPPVLVLLPLSLVVKAVSDAPSRQAGDQSCIMNYYPLSLTSVLSPQIRPILVFWRAVPPASVSFTPESTSSSGTERWCTVPVRPMRD